MHQCLMLSVRLLPLFSGLRTPSFFARLPMSQKTVQKESEKAGVRMVNVP